MTSAQETNENVQLMFVTLQDLLQRYNAASLTDAEVGALDAAVTTFQAALDAVPGTLPPEE